MKVKLLKSELVEGKIVTTILSEEPIKVGSNYFISNFRFSHENIKEVLEKAIMLSATSSREKFDEVHRDLCNIWRLYN